jgi:hypothetical protein
MSAGGYAPVASPPSGADRVRPSGWWFVVAGAIAAGGIVAGLWMMVSGVDYMLQAVRGFDRTEVPGTVAVDIAEPGGYSIYHEFPGAADTGGLDDAFGDPGVDPPEVTVTDPSGDDVPVAEYSSVVTYSEGNREGRGAYTFDADRPGVYEVSAEGPPGAGIAVGRGMGDVGADALLGLFGGFVGGTIVGVLGVLVGAILAIAVGVARSRNRRQAPMPAPGGWAPMPVPAWGGTPHDTLTWTRPAAAPTWSPQPSGLPPEWSGGRPEPGWPAPTAPLPASPSGPGVTPASQSPGSGSQPASVPPGPPHVPAGSSPGEPHVPAGSSPSGSDGAVVPIPSGSAERPDPPLPWPAAGHSRADPTRRCPAPTLVHAGAEPTVTQPLSQPGDPPSLRSPHDWSRSDVEIPWDPETL